MLADGGGTWRRRQGREVGRHGVRRVAQGRSVRQVGHTRGVRAREVGRLGARGMRGRGLGRGAGPLGPGDRSRQFGGNGLQITHSYMSLSEGRCQPVSQTLLDDE
jgi:hypothetical protein